MIKHVVVSIEMVGFNPILGDQDELVAAITRALERPLDEGDSPELSNVSMRIEVKDAGKEAK